eukprot:TRINITY_DN11636_c0_g3_i2.p1 TRINITY_DN11636_c0_g3~~TRINITY_DN11636_c0_g3_i2.p1  ORF type:complete len:437 (-),score=123.33 TRINITY_DN11636_c0_g3_i2:121-1431(-)
MDNAISGIDRLLQDVPGYAYTTPPDVAAAVEEVLVSVSRVIFSPSHAEMMEATQACVTSVEDLLNTSVTLSKTPGIDPFVHEQLMDMSKAVARATTGLLELAKLGNTGGSSTNQGRYVETSGKISQAANGVMAALRRFPGGERIKPVGGQDLGSIVEAELVTCLRILDEISKKIGTLPKITPKNKTPTSVGLLDIAEISGSIVETCVSCCKTTCHLVHWSLGCHRERMKNVEITWDPVWCQGLISASQNVSDSVQDLFVGASQAARGEGDEEKLVRCANNLASASSSLVSASNVSAGLTTLAQQNLLKAAKAVAHATAKMSLAAQTISLADIHCGGGVGAGGEGGGVGGVSGGNGELEHQIEILKLEKQLEKEKTRANLLKQARPVSIYLQGNRTSVYGLPQSASRASIYVNRQSLYGGRSSIYGIRASVGTTGGS